MFTVQWEHRPQSRNQPLHAAVGACHSPNTATFVYDWGSTPRARLPSTAQDSMPAAVAPSWLIARTPDRFAGCAVVVRAGCPAVHDPVVDHDLPRLGTRGLEHVVPHRVRRRRTRCRGRLPRSVRGRRLGHLAAPSRPARHARVGTESPAPAIHRRHRPARRQHLHHRCAATHRSPRPSSRDAGAVDVHWRVHDLAQDCVDQGGSTRPVMIDPPARKD